MARQQPKRKPNPDADLQSKRQRYEKAKAGWDKMASDAKANSNSSFRGMDDVDYSGPNRRAYNWGSAQSSRSQLRINDVNAEQSKRDASRAATTKNITDRQKRKRR